MPARLLLACLAILFATPAAPAQEIEWRADLQTAMADSKSTGRPVLMHFTSARCRPCQELKSFVLASPRVVECTNQLTVPVTVDADAAPELVQKYSVKTLPSQVFVDAAGRPFCRRDAGDGDRLQAASWIELVERAAGTHRKLLEGDSGKLDQVTEIHQKWIAARSKPADGPEEFSIEPFHMQGVLAKPASPGPEDTVIRLPAKPDPTAAPPKNPEFKFTTPVVSAAGQEGTPKSAETFRFSVAEDPLVAPVPLPGETGTPAPPTDDAGNMSLTVVAPGLHGETGNGGYVSDSPVGAPGSGRDDPTRQGPVHPPTPQSTVIRNPFFTQPTAELAQQGPATDPAATGAAKGASMPTRQATDLLVPPPSPPTPPSAASAIIPHSPLQNAKTEQPADLCLEGFCPVTLLEAGSWTRGDPSIGCSHRGRVYLFVNETARQKFMAAPDQWSPLLGGFDPVVLFSQGRLATGKRQFGIFMTTGRDQSQVVLFESTENQLLFKQDTEKYLQAILAATGTRSASRSDAGGR